MVSPFEKLKRLHLFYFTPQIVLYWHRNPQHRSAIPSNPNKLSTLSRAITPSRAIAQNNATLNKAGLNFGLPAPGPPALDLGPLTLVDFQFFMKTIIKMAKNQVSLVVSAIARKKTFNKLLKTRNLDLYYGNLPIEYYYFCQQCKDYFETTEVKSHRRVAFIASFLKQ